MIQNEQKENKPAWNFARKRH